VLLFLFSLLLCWRGDCNFHNGVNDNLSLLLIFLVFIIILLSTPRFFIRGGQSVLDIAKENDQKAEIIAALQAAGAR
jgi:hypothetical protein